MGEVNGECLVLVDRKVTHADNHCVRFVFSRKISWNEQHAEPCGGWVTIAQDNVEFDIFTKNRKLRLKLSLV